ncbi:MAG: TonB-dependent receptor, partial [Gemmatimonadota bacterium]|nr:TonB-dependent receptor [Gemmatimonadota bacterium]
GSPWGSGLTGPADPNGITDLTVVESSAKSRYHGVTIGLRRTLSPDFQFEANYTLSWDKSDDDNERDPFTIRIADHTMLEAEYGFSDRDRRHSANGYFLFHLANGINVNNIFRLASASPVSENCIAGGRAGSPSDRICADGSVLERNTLRRDNGFFTWNLRVSKAFPIGGSGNSIEPIFEVFNLTNADNFLDTSQGGLLFNFDGTIRSGLGDTRRAQVGIKYRF